MKKKKCHSCPDGNYKKTVRPYVMKTCHETRPEITFENLPVEECVICGHVVVPETSEKYLDYIRQKVRQEMEELAKRSQAPESTFDRFKSALKNFKG